MILGGAKNIFGGSCSRHHAYDKMKAAKTVLFWGKAGSLRGCVPVAMNYYGRHESAGDYNRKFATLCRNLLRYIHWYNYILYTYLDEYSRPT